MLLRNAYVTLNAGQTAEYLNMMPPTLEDWCSQGPNAKPLPPNFAFSDNYEPPSDDDVDGLDE
ncbi:MAG: hypothetical protein H7329_17990 [Opitutaceae bacterium]|nr:hypothetical protein [Cytophagales bacterium]